MISQIKPQRRAFQLFDDAGAAVLRAASYLTVDILII